VRERLRDAAPFRFRDSVAVLSDDNVALSLYEELLDADDVDDSVVDNVAETEATTLNVCELDDDLVKLRVSDALPVRIDVDVIDTDRSPVVLSVTESEMLVVLLEESVGVDVAEAVRDWLRLRDEVSVNDSDCSTVNDMEWVAMFDHVFDDVGETVGEVSSLGVDERVAENVCAAVDDIEADHETLVERLRESDRVTLTSLEIDRDSEALKLRVAVTVGLGSSEMVRESVDERVRE